MIIVKNHSKHPVYSKITMTNVAENCTCAEICQDFKL